MPIAELRVLVCALTVAAAALGPGDENWFQNGGVDGPRGWEHTGGGGSVEFTVDRRAGAAERGSLSISNEDDSDRVPHNWRQRVALPADDRPARLRLACRVRVQGAGPGSEACLIANLYDENGEAVGHVRCPEVRADGDWQTIETVFEPEGTAVELVAMAYWVGAGTAWFDDLELAPTIEPVTRRAPPADADPRMEDLARGAAADLPWVFDADAAVERARRESKPLLVYVRCTDDREHVDAAHDSIRADGVRLLDDGYSKDLLFRAGPLSDPDVRALVRRRTVPVCLTYVLGDHTYGAAAPPGWGSTGMPGQVVFGVDANEGDRGPGCLTIQNTDLDDDRAHNWFQRIDAPEDTPTVLELSASIKVSEFQAGSQATVMVQVWQGSEAVAYGRLPEVHTDTDWKRKSAKFSVPAGADAIRVLAYLVGPGQAWFDDVAIRPTEGREPPNLLANGGLDEAAGGYRGFPVDPRTTTAPALVLCDADGTALRRLHRFGALSSELVDRWLRGALAEAGATAALDHEARSAGEAWLDGDLERVLRRAAEATDDETRLLGARAHLRRGDLDAARTALADLSGPDADCVRGLLGLRTGAWEEALAAFDAALEAPGEGADPELRADARFRRALCLDRLGRHAEARSAWLELAGESVAGRRAAACLLDAGPRLHLALSERAWPREDELPEETELGRPDPFDPRASLALLIELQRADGSFGTHQGREGYGWVDPAITAICVDALRVWEPRLAGEERERAATARERALAWLVAWAAQPYPGSGAFNDPYALVTLIAEEEMAAAERVIGHIAETQLADGNWTVYGPERPASFNTALAVLALSAAKKARLDVPKETLSKGVRALEDMRTEAGLFPYSTADGHEWMTTEHGSIARDPLCELALLRAGRGSKKSLEAALLRYVAHAHELRTPTKRLYDYFNSRGHGGYYFFFAHRNAVEAAVLAKSKTERQARAVAQDAVLAAREGDGTFVDKFLLGRAYGTAMALLVLAE